MKNPLFILAAIAAVLVGLGGCSTPGTSAIGTTPTVAGQSAISGPAVELEPIDSFTEPGSPPRVAECHEHDVNGNVVVVPGCTDEAPADNAVDAAPDAGKGFDSGPAKDPSKAA